jgi:hypothetical protein
MGNPKTDTPSRKPSAAQNGTDSGIQARASPPLRAPLTGHRRGSSRQLREDNIPVIDSRAETLLDGGHKTLETAETYWSGRRSTRRGNSPRQVGAGEVVPAEQDAVFGGQCATSATTEACSERALRCTSSCAPTAIDGLSFGWARPRRTTCGQHRNERSCSG